jgi:hypothetical protein
MIFLLAFVVIVVLAVSAAVVFIPWARITGKVPKGDRFNWWLPIGAAIGSLILFLPTIIYSGDNDMLYIIIAPFICLIFLVVALLYAIRKKKQYCLAALSMLVVYGSVSWGLLKNSSALYSSTQWLFDSKAYKAKILAQPATTDGTLKHIEWDESGFAGVGVTDEYLVFDPSDSLSVAAKSHSSGKFKGIPCEVPRVRRLESHYYTVLFYTNADWEHCN